MFKLIVVIVFMQGGEPQSVRAEHTAPFETLAECMAEAANLATYPAYIALQASCVPIAREEVDA